MLLRIKIKNFLSFREEQVFDMFPNPEIQQFPGHVIGGSVPLLKYSAIYGPNSTGKSNFIKAFLFLKRFVTDIDGIANVDRDSTYFLLASSIEDPISIEIEFLQQSKYLKYVFNWSDSIEETLAEINIEDGSVLRVIFSRKGSDLHSDYVTNIKNAKQLLRSNPKSSVVSLNMRYPVIDDDCVRYAYNWFRKTLDIITIESSFTALIAMLDNDRKMLSFMSDLFKNLKICEKVRISETPFNEWILTRKGLHFQSSTPAEVHNASNVSANNNRRNEFVIVDKGGMRIVLELKFLLTGADGYAAELDIDSQSDGTVRLLSMIPFLYRLALTPCLYVVDEIEWSMHPNLITTVLKSLSNSKSKGQLIFTTHMPQLMNQQEILRRDEFWLTDKYHGYTIMHSLNEFIINDDSDLASGYLLGRYGAVPNVSVGKTSEVFNNE